jgi:hypothetical protein
MMPYRRSRQLGQCQQYVQGQHVENQADDGDQCHALRTLAAALVAEGAQNRPQGGRDRQRDREQASGPQCSADVRSEIHVIFPSGQRKLAEFSEGLRPRLGGLRGGRSTVPTVNFPGISTHVNGLRHFSPRDFRVEWQVKGSIPTARTIA